MFQWLYACAEWRETGRVINFTTVLFFIIHFDWNFFGLFFLCVIRFQRESKKKKKSSRGGNLECCEGGRQLEQLHVASSKMRISPLDKNLFFLPLPSPTRQLLELLFKKKKKEQVLKFPVSFQTVPVWHYTQQQDSIWKKKKKKKFSLLRLLLFYKQLLQENIRGYEGG